MATIEDRKLVIFAGKGGVGKTTSSSAAALWLARQGKKTLVVTVDPAKRLEDSLGQKVGFEETRVDDNLYALMMDPSSIMEEVVQRHAPDDVDKEEVLDHALFEYVSRNMPGLNELLAIGKLMDMQDEGRYDVIVVDTAPTGHALTFLSAPQNVEELFQERSLVRLAVRSYDLYRKVKRASSGVLSWFTSDETEDIPDLDFERIFQAIAAEARRIHETLTDTDHTVLNLVTIPEKLPTEETIDLYREVTEDLDISVGAVVVNKVQPDRLGETRDDFLRLLEDEPLKEELKEHVARKGYDPDMWGRVVKTVEFSDLRRQMNLRYIEQIEDAIPVPVVEVPLFEEEVVGLDALNGFADELFEGGLAGELGEQDADGGTDAEVEPAA